MGIIINQSIRNAAISYFGIALGFISSIILFPTILGPEKFGLTRTILAIAIIGDQVVSLGLPNSIIRFFPSLKEEAENHQGTYWVFTILPLLGFIVFGCLFLLLKEYILGLYVDSSLLREYYFLVLPLIASIALYSLLNAFIKAAFNTVFASFLQDILLRVLIIIDLILFYFELISFDVFMLIFVGNYAVIYLILFLYGLKKSYINFSVDFKPFTKKLNTEIFKYNVFAFFSGFTMITVGNIDLLMVDVFEGLSQTGVYAVALYVGSVIAVPKKTITKISFPIISDYFKKNDLENVRKIYQQSSLNQFLIGLLIYIGVIANLDNLYTILPETFADGSIVIVIIGLANLFDMVTGANGQIIISSKYYKFDFFASCILMISSIILNLILIPKYGLAGAATATATSIFLFNFVKVIYVWIKLKIQPFSINTIAIFILGLIVLYLSTFIPKLHSIYIDIPIRSALMATVYLGFVWIFNLSEEVNNLIRTFIARLKS